MPFADAHPHARALGLGTRYLKGGAVTINKSAGNVLIPLTYVHVSAGNVLIPLTYVHVRTMGRA